MAVVRRAGWQRDEETGKNVFCVVVEYRDQDSAPEFPIDAVWKETPVEIVLRDTK